MPSPLLQALTDNASLSIIGMCKNAGKTTVLNRLIALLGNDPRIPSLTSIGRDGESIDSVTHTHKPGIWMRQGMLAATASGLLRFSDVSKEILHTTGMRTPLGEVVIFRALSDGAVQLAGPSMTVQLETLVFILRALGAGIVLIDGALSRKSLAAPHVSEATILCTGAAYASDISVVVADTAYACHLLTLPKSAGDHPGRSLVSGALTDAMLSRLSPKPGEEISVRDSGCLLISRQAFEKATARGVTFTVINPGTLCCVCVNPTSPSGVSFDKAELLARMAEAVPVPVINAWEDSDD